MDIQEQWQNTKLVLKLTGALDGMNAPQLETELEKLRETAPVITSLVLDFSEVSLISSMGIRVILKAMKWLKEGNAKLSIINMPDAVREAFNLTGLIGLFVHDEKLIVIVTDKSSAKIILSLAGTFDNSTFGILDEKLEELYKADAPLIILDCAKVSNPMQAEERQFLETVSKRLNTHNKRLVIRN
jgi:anti-anti-sigma factor